MRASHTGETTLARQTKLRDWQCFECVRWFVQAINKTQDSSRYIKQEKENMIKLEVMTDDIEV